ncbi:hypothetical protein AK812_SmicGene32538 [Symbiodinium microadriaticum]|uniref:Uncharacterized protein n=1 Tax=Symbiodinium microadriaticum TaxID=2951 RepID=A0A1Q9CTW1_SYMMI|nr:hypothetical protein AK812_SmicGene32538 [Symbiodinium microadriaticum]
MARRRSALATETYGVALPAMATWATRCLAAHTLSLWCVCFAEIAAESAGRHQPLALWATVEHNSSAEAAPTYASMAGNDPASGKDWKSKPKQQVKAWNNSMQHTYHTYIPGKYQAFPSKVASIRADTAGSTKEQSFHDYSRSYGGLGQMGVQQAKHAKHGHSNKHADSTDGSHDGHESSDDYQHFMPDFSAHDKGPGGDEQLSSDHLDMREDYKKYMNSYNTHGPSNKYVPDLDELREDERSDFIPSGSEEPAASPSRNSRLRSGDHGEDTSKTGQAQQWSLGSYMHRTGWKKQLSGVIPSFVPGEFASAQPAPAAASSKFLARPSVGNTAEDSADWWQLPVVIFAALAFATLVKASSRRTITPPEQLLG